MVALSITAGNVLQATGATTEVVTYGATITQGQAVYLDTTTSTWKLADADATVLTAAVGGISLTSGVATQKGVICTAGNINPGATVAIGTAYALDGAGVAGAIAPIADLGSGDWVSILGIATTTSNILLKINVSGVQVP